MVSIDRLHFSVMLLLYFRLNSFLFFFTRTATHFNQVQSGTQQLYITLYYYNNITTPADRSFPLFHRSYYIACRLLFILHENEQRVLTAYSSLDDAHNETVYIYTLYSS